MMARSTAGACARPHPRTAIKPRTPNVEPRTLCLTPTSFDNSKATYFNDGWVDEDADIMSKFFGGGKKKGGGEPAKKEGGGFKWPWE